MGHFGGTWQIPSDPQRIGDPVDVVAPGSDQGDLENSTIVEPGLAKRIMVRPGAAGSVLRQCHDVVERRAVPEGKWELACNRAVELPPFPCPTSLYAETLRGIRFNKNSGWSPKRWWQSFRAVSGGAADPAP